MSEELMEPGVEPLAAVPSDIWIDLLDPDADTLRRILPTDLHETVWDRLLEPVADEPPRPRLEAHDSYVFGVLVVPLSMSLRETKTVVAHEIVVILTPEHLFSVRKSSTGIDPFECDEVRHTASRHQESAGMCLFRLMDHIAEHFLDLIDDVDGDINQLEDDVETLSATEIRVRIGVLRHDLLHVRRWLAPTRDAARAVLDDRVDLRGTELFPREIELHFADTYDKLLRATDGLDLARDLLAGVRDYHQAKVANDQNDVMKKLTVIASMVLLPTFIVGLYGQNLKGGPEFAWRNGYLFSWLLILSTSVAQFVYFKRKRWI